MGEVNCEHLKNGESCSAILGNDEARTARHKNCQSDNKEACCYLCPSYQTCEISCGFLGENKNTGKTTEMSGEKELLRGKWRAGFLEKVQPIVLTTKRLIIGDRIFNFNDILEVYAQQERLKSKLMIRLKDGTLWECGIISEKSVSALTFFGGGIGAQESEMRANYRAAVDRWVNLINRCLSSVLIS